MGNLSMFELEHELQKWTKRFGKHDSMRSCDVEELQQHLRDSIAELTSMGLNEEESFLIATRRVGKPDEVGQEFEKVNGNYTWARRVLKLPTSPMVLLMLVVIGFCTIAWMFEAQMSDLRRQVGPLRAAQEGRFVIEQYAFTPGQNRLYAPLESYDSASEFVSKYESEWLSHCVPVGSYGEKWILVDHTGNPLSLLSDRLKNKPLQDAGIKPGNILRVVKGKDGRFTI